MTHSEGVELGNIGADFFKSFVVKENQSTN